MTVDPLVAVAGVVEADVVGVVAAADGKGKRVACRRRPTAAAAVDACRRAGCAVVEVVDDDEDHFWWFHRAADIEKGLDSWPGADPTG